MDIAQSRLVLPEVIYEGKDISSFVNADLISMSVSDSADGSADEVTISLQDKDHNWLENWICQPGDTISLSATSYNWNEKGEEYLVNYGTFYVDEPKHTIKPCVFSLKGVSFPATGNFRDVVRTKTYSNAKISTIAKTIADRYDFELALDIEKDKTIKEIEQSRQSDFEFLKSLCLENDICLKMYDKKIVLFSQSVYENKEPIAVISSNDMLQGAEFSRSMTDCGYKQASLVYKKAKGQVIKANFSAPNSTNTKILYLDDACENQAEALEICKTKLREKNRKDFSGGFSIPGLSKINAGDTVEITDCGQYDGIYYIDSKTQSISPTVAQFSVHKVLGY